MSSEACKYFYGQKISQHPPVTANAPVVPALAARADKVSVCHSVFPNANPSPSVQEMGKPKLFLADYDLGCKRNSSQVKYYFLITIFRLIKSYGGNPFPVPLLHRFVGHQFKQGASFAEIVDSLFQVKESLPLAQCFRQLAAPEISITFIESHFDELSQTNHQRSVAKDTSQADKTLLHRKAKRTTLDQRNRGE